MNFSWAMDLDPKGANSQIKDALDRSMNKAAQENIDIGTSQLDDHVADHGHLHEDEDDEMQEDGSGRLLLQQLMDIGYYRNQKIREIDVPQLNFEKHQVLNEISNPGVWGFVWKVLWREKWIQGKSNSAEGAAKI